MQKEYTDRFELNKLQVISGSISALILFILAFFVLYVPFSATETVRSGGGQVVRYTTTSQDPTYVFIVIFLSGFAIGTFALNGLRFSKITAGAFTAESPSPSQKAEEYYDKVNPAPEETIDLSDKISPTPNESPVSHVYLNDERVAVYPLSAVPASVLSDALSAWPQSMNKPDDFSSFEFASRKTGKGNHPWTIKFREKPAVTVTYGGQGKSAATVSRES